MITHPWQRAHVQMLEQGELRVRTHLRPDPPVDRFGDAEPVRNKLASAFRREAIRRWLAEGLRKSIMAERLNITERAVDNHLKAIHKEKKA